ncbi:hypothetical protein EFN92_03870 [Lactococcus lactis]|uniref:ETX/MTX2 family pore-forming toxin n=1 Tax=Lactococcus lactis TaxID=1358 RepID=UPI0021A33EED|nr:ETX/MTX2 family pore-forming toxin [Lactococcus lactis]MCT3091815.1 hypothetical protein [Lactococcus lactis]
MSKKLVSLVAVCTVAFGGIGALSSTSLSVHADVKGDSITAPLNDRLKTISQQMYNKYRKSNSSWGGLTPKSDWKGQNFISASIPENTWITEGSQLGEPSQTEVIPIFFGESPLSNDTDRTQTLYSDSFKHTVSTVTTTTTSTKFNAGLGSITVPIISKTLKKDLNFNSNTTNESKETVTNEMISPSQPVSIPPHSKVVVKVSLLKAKYIGKVNLKATSNRADSSVYFNAIRGLHTGGQQTKKITEKMPFNFVTRLNSGYLFDDQHIQYTPYILNGSPEVKLSYQGEGDYTFENGSKYEVNVSDVKTKKVLSTRIVDINQ